MLDSSRLTFVSSRRVATRRWRTAVIATASHLHGLQRATSSTPTDVPLSFTIDPSSGLLRTVVTGRFGRDEGQAYANDLRAHPELARVERRLVDVRPSAIVTADELLDLLVLEHDIAGSARRTDRRAILLHSDNGPALGRELVVADRRQGGIPVAYRVFRTSSHAYRYLRVDPRLTLPDRGRRIAR